MGRPVVLQSLCLLNLTMDSPCLLRESTCLHNTYAANTLLSCAKLVADEKLINVCLQMTSTMYTYIVCWGIVMHLYAHLAMGLEMGWQVVRGWEEVMAKGLEKATETEE
jgi:hypothetical protein